MCTKRCADIAEFTINLKKVQIFSCPSCKKEYGTEDEMKKHTGSVHMFPCTICLKNFITKSPMDIHVKWRNMPFCVRFVREEI